MAQTRRRRLIRWAALATVILLPVLVWLTTRESAAILLSQTIRPGMTRAEVEQILGRSAVTLESANETALLYGASPIPRLLRTCAENWLGINGIGGDFHVDDWPVRIWFDTKDGRVSRVQRNVDGRAWEFAESEG